MRWVILGAFLAITVPAVAGEAPVRLEALRWLTGSWMDDGGRASSEHLWTSVRGGTMLGLQRDIDRDGNAWVEFVKVHETPAGIVFTVIPLGQAQTDFALVSSSERRVVFENPAHDFPRRIIYWLEDDDTLVARIEGPTESGQRASEWRWRRVEAEQTSGEPARRGNGA